jgi:SAM-dependent methyltransferase
LSEEELAELQPTDRFSDRVENYVKYRPQYPPAIVGFLEEHLGLTPASVVADIGSGTGFLSRPFLAHGNVVYGVEPNRSMREAGEELLREFPNFRSVEGTAEATTLAARSIDFVTAGQAFHWFDIPRARAEFQRILRPGGWVVLVWNNRLLAASPFYVAYENLLLKYGTDYTKVSSRHADEAALREFFQTDFSLEVFDNHQDFDYEGFRGRLLSSSYIPLEPDPHYAPMLDELRKIFDEHQTPEGRVRFEYETEVYYGQIKS